MASSPANGRRRPSSSKAAARALSVALAAALVAGCGGSSKPSGAEAGDASAPSSDSGAAPGPTTPPLPNDQPQKAACSLVTQAEVEAAVGGRVTPGRQDAQQGRSVCAFTFGSAGDQSVVVVSTSSSGVTAAFDAARASAENPQPVNAGDAAFATGGQAVVRKGTTMVAIIVALRQQPAQLTSAATRLAQAAAARI